MHLLSPVNRFPSSRTSTILERAVFSANHKCRAAGKSGFRHHYTMVGRGYVKMPLVEENLAEHFPPNSAAAWKSRPLLPLKPCRVTSSLVGKSFSAVGQAAATLHSMAVLQAPPVAQPHRHKRKGQIYSHGCPDIPGWTVWRFSHCGGG